MRSGCGLFCVLPLLAQIPAPLYTPSSIVNAASSRAEPLAPNTIATIYGRDLAFTSRAVAPEEVRGNMLPTVLIGTGVRVTVNGISAGLYYVSPGQINFLVPVIEPGAAEIRVSRDGLYGLAARVAVAEAAPALFQMDPEFAVATHVDGSVLTFDRPAGAGEIVILYATGLGRTRPQAATNEIPARAAPLERGTSFRVTVGGEPAAVLYAGVAPGFAGLQQINVRLPGSFGRDPEVRIGFGEAMSPEGVRLHADPGQPAAAGIRLD